MIYLLASDVAFALLRGDPAAIAWADRVDKAAVAMGVVTLGEIACAVAEGAFSDEERRELKEWLRKLQVVHSGRILPVTPEVAVRWGAIAAARGRGETSDLTAATAIVHDLILVTGRERDFEDVGASTVSPWR